MKEVNLLSKMIFPSVMQFRLYRYVLRIGSQLPCTTTPQARFIIIIKYFCVSGGRPRSSSKRLRFPHGKPARFCNKGPDYCMFFYVSSRRPRLSPECPAQEQMRGGGLQVEVCQQVFKIPCVHVLLSERTVLPFVTSLKNYVFPSSTRTRKKKEET